MATLPPPELRLKRFIHISNESPTYRPGLRFKANLLEDNQKVIESIVADARDKDVASIILKAFTDGYSICPETLVLALAVAARQDTHELRDSAYVAARTVCISPENLFLFVSYHCHLTPSMTVAKGIKRLITDWYMKREPMELLKAVLECRSAHGWSHKDLIKLCHINTKSNPGVFAVTTYICKGLAKMKLECADMPEAKPVIAYLDAVATFRWYEVTDSAEADRFASTHKISFNQLAAGTYHQKWVWLNYIPKLSLRFVLGNIKRLGHMRFINEGQPIADAVIKALTDQESIAKSNLHPAEVLLVLRKYENITILSQSAEKRNPKHTNPENQLSLAVNPAIVEALNTLLTSTFKLLVPTGLRYMVVVDTDNKMSTGRCYQSSCITPLMAASLMALSLVKTERSVLVGTYATGGSIHTLRLGKNATLQETHDKLKATASSPVDLSQPINWAKNKAKGFDVFLLITSNQVRQEQLMSPAKAIQQYRKKMNLPLAKVVVCGLTCIAPFNVADPEDSGMFDIAGFDGKVPRAIEAFSRGAF